MKDPVHVVIKLLHFLQAPVNAVYAFYAGHLHWWTLLHLFGGQMYFFLCTLLFAPNSSAEYMHNTCRNILLSYAPAAGTKI